MWPKVLKMQNRKCQTKIKGGEWVKEKLRAKH